MKSQREFRASKSQSHCGALIDCIYVANTSHGKTVCLIVALGRVRGGLGLGEFPNGSASGFPLRGDKEKDLPESVSQGIQGNFSLSSLRESDSTHCFRNSKKIQSIFVRV